MRSDHRKTFHHYCCTFCLPQLPEHSSCWSSSRWSEFAGKAHPIHPYRAMATIWFGRRPIRTPNSLLRSSPRPRSPCRWSRSLIVTPSSRRAATGTCRRLSLRSMLFTRKSVTLARSVFRPMPDHWFPASIAICWNNKPQVPGWMRTTSRSSRGRSVIWRQSLRFWSAVPPITSHVSRLTRHSLPLTRWAGIVTKEILTFFTTQWATGRQKRRQSSPGTAPRPVRTQFTRSIRRGEAAAGTAAVIPPSPCPRLRIDLFRRQRRAQMSTRPHEQHQQPSTGVQSEGKYETREEKEYFTSVQFRSATIITSIVKFNKNIHKHTHTDTWERVEY